MLDRWPTKEDLQEAKVAEAIRARAQDDEADPICECGQPAYVCICEQLAMELGYRADGSGYESA
jgi:hypothetical protein